MMARLSNMDKRRRAQMFGFMTAGEDAGEIAAPVAAGFLVDLWSIPIMLGARIGLAAFTEVYTVVVSHRYLPAEEGPTTFKMRLAVPVRLAAGIMLGFTSGWMTGDLQQRYTGKAAAHDASGPHRPAVARPGR
jgi:MFS family permease